MITKAERAALEAVLKHGTTKEAAVSLGKSRRTLEAQLYTARQRLGVERTIEAVRVVFIEERPT